MVARIFKIIVIVITALIVLVIWAGMSLFKGIDLGGRPDTRLHPE
ncbi:hypothetical protein [Aggregatibacter aphrophilus]|nr:hypothetical protein [Aggregatibacter aphrophilus]